MYTTTLHVLNSAIVKLKNLTPAAVVYRGLSQKRMPASFKRVDSELNIRSVHAPSFTPSFAMSSPALSHPALTHLALSHLALTYPARTDSLGCARHASPQWRRGVRLHVVLNRLRRGNALRDQDG